MSVIGTVVTLLMLLGVPKSADVVTVELKQGSLADGLECYHPTLRIERGWHVFANPPKAKAAADSTITVEFFIDGKPAFMHDVYYPRSVVRKDAAGKEYPAYEGTIHFTGWLIYDDTKDAKVISVRVKLTATDGKTRRKESVVTAEVRQ